MTERQQAEPQPQSGGGNSSLMRSGAIMALGTIASRLTGFVRTAVIVIALGTSLGSIYNLSNTIPNIVYDLLLGGILSSVVVPLLVKARRQDKQYGEEYEQRVFTAAVLFLLAITIGAVLLASVIMNAYNPDLHGKERDVAVLFAVFFLPQIFFYGVGAFAGAILNTRNSFAAPMWAPVLNNIVVIAMGGIFLFLHTGDDPTAANISDTEFLLLAIGTTGGIVLQTVALWPSLRRVGWKWRPRLDFRPGELGLVGRTAGWTLFYVVMTQIGFLMVTRFVNGGDALAKEAGLGSSYGFASYSTAYQFFQLPYAIVAVSVITALLPRMSQHAAEDQKDLVRDDFSSGLRLSSVLIIPGAALLLTLSGDIATAFLQHGKFTAADAAVIARIMQVFAVALVPFAIYQLMLRVFYAYRDTRTPALVAIATVITNIVCAYVAYETLEPQDIVTGIAAAFVVTNVVGVVVCSLVLRRRLGRMDAGRIIAAHVKMLAAAGPLAAFAWGCHVGFEKWAGTGLVPSLLALVVGSVGGGILYLVSARLLHVAEVETMTRALSARIPGLR
ncbi:murein biosynthesis integral membrane protein MurJ [Actinocorallia longicatena]|uniref:Lipid II flippase MurJ n=1 Tax=Actinocorallia longicatena TaxID=111803 RepID=A0ABP6QC36_9ACTN